MPHVPKLPIPLRREGRETLVDCKWLRVHRDRVLQNETEEREYWMVDYRKLGVGVVPILDDGRVLLGLHYRYATDRWGWEIAAGGTEGNEDRALTATRELEEETGHRARELRFLGEFHPAPGLGNEHFHLYAAVGLEPLGTPPDPEEILRLEPFTWAEIEESQRRGELSDGFTWMGLLWCRTLGLLH